jgi:predicted Zn-dependent protease
MQSGQERVMPPTLRPDSSRGLRRAFLLLLLPMLLPLALVACGTNPVTGKSEIQFVSEAQEVRIGEENYAPTRQSEGGDFKQVPELSAYVNEVGQKLARVSEEQAVGGRKLPYEFVVLNSSIPNAWALPGGKIAINRGLLTELRNEAELAAVLGHEIVHAAARHGAKATERGTLLQAGLAAAQIGAALGGADENVAGLVLGGAGVGAQLIQTRYGREQELQSDLYGMRYMKAAGYDPQGAVTLQETFMRLSEGRQQGWLQGLFASHPPSPERVARNKQTAMELGAGGELGVERYAARLAPVLKLKPGYDKYDAAMTALQKKDFAGARSLAQQAVQAVPQEGRFHQLLGDIAVSEKKYSEAVPHYEKAIAQSPDYFGSYLGAGVAQYRLGNRDRAVQWLEQSARLLPTAPAALYLGNIARDRGDRAGALKYYQAAAGSQNALGQEAAAEAARLDLPQNPGAYVAAGLQSDAAGRVLVVVQNRSAVALQSVRVTTVVVDAAGRVVQQGNALVVAGPIAPGKTAGVDSGLSGLTPAQIQSMRVRIDAAQIAQ